MSLLGKWLGIVPKKQPLSLSDRNFEAEVMRSAVPVLIDVWGSGCGPCKQLEPIIMELAAQYEGRVKVCELHAERAPIALGRLGIRGTPTVLYFQDGRELERVVGFRSSLFHRQTIEELFGIAAA